MNPQETQIGGTHYKDLAIQPIEFIHANKLNFLEGCVLKRLCRHRRKNGIEDLRKAIHEIELMIELEYGKEVDAEDAAVAKSRINEPMLDAEPFMCNEQMKQRYEMYERLNGLHCEFLERLNRLYASILKGEISKHQKDRVEIITNTPKPRTATENCDAVELPSITGSGWHNPENVTQEQLGEGYRFLVPWEVEANRLNELFANGLLSIWMGSRGQYCWDTRNFVVSSRVTYAVKKLVPIPPKPTSPEPDSISAEHHTDSRCASTQTEPHPKPENQ